MFLPAILIASAALSSFQLPICDPIFIPSPKHNVLFVIDPDTGAIREGAADVFANDGLGVLSIVTHPVAGENRFFQYRRDPSQPCFDQIRVEKGLLVKTPPLISPEGIEIRRKIYIPYEPAPQTVDLSEGKDHIRYYERLVNRTSQPITVDVEFSGTFSPVADTVAPPVDRADNGWTFIGDPQFGKPYVGLIFYRGLQYRSDRIAELRYSQEDGKLAAVFKDVVLQPNKPVGFLLFVVQTWMPMAAVGPNSDASLRSLSEIGTQSMDDVLKDPDMDEIPPEDGRSFWNWFIDTDVNVDGYVNILDMVVVRNDLGKTPDSASNPRCDVNADLRINIIDLILVRNDLGWPY